MTTYRTGNHQPQNLYRGDQYIGVMFSPIDAAAFTRHMNRVETCDCDTYEPCNGECCGVGMCSCSTEPTAHTPDVNHTRGAAEALALVADRIANAGARGNVRPSLALLRSILEDVTADLGIDQEKPADSIPPHSTCVEVTRLTDLPRRRWVCGPGCPR